MWGPLPEAAAAVLATASGAEAQPTPAPTRKRKSRWSTSDQASAEAGAQGDGDGNKAIMLFPEKVVLSNGLQVVLPPAVTGRAPGGDPRTLELHKQVGAAALCRLPCAAWQTLSSCFFAGMHAIQCAAGLAVGHSSAAGPCVAAARHLLLCPTRRLLRCPAPCRSSSRSTASC